MTPLQTSCATWARIASRILLLVSLALPGSSVTAASKSAEEPKATACDTVEVFSRQGCPHCARAYGFLEQLQQNHPQIEIIRRDIDSSRANRQRFIQLVESHGIERPGVPLLLICGQVMVGFDAPETSGRDIVQLLGLADTGGAKPAADAMEVPVFGLISVERLGLPLFTLMVGLVDGFNPCAMWVLLVLLSVLLSLRDRKRLLLIAGTFVLVSGAVYFAFMAAWLNLFLIIGFSRPLQLVVGIVAILIGSVHIKEFFAFHKGLSLSIPDAAKPTIYQHMRRVIYAENMTGAIIGVIIVAALVNLVELLCTAGLPAMYTQILVLQGLEPAGYYGYLLLYNLAYIFDDAVMVGIVVYTLSSHRLQRQQGRWLKLLSGGVILVLGILLVFAPGALI